MRPLVCSEDAKSDGISKETIIMAMITMIIIIVILLLLLGAVEMWVVFFVRRS